MLPLVVSVGMCHSFLAPEGNIATDDLVCMLEGMGISAGIDLNKVTECSMMAEEIYGQVCPSRVLRVGPLRK